jgi:hypothetical protein
MRTHLTLLLSCVFTFTLGLTHISAQSISCSCADTPENTCHGTVTCPDGCTAVCGSKDTCYLSCRTDLLASPVTLRFVKKDGKFIAKTLSAKVNKEIKFEPYKRREKELYTFELKKSDIWPILSFLNKRGVVTVNNKDFRIFLKMQREVKMGRRLSVRFEGISANEVVEKLSFLTRFDLRIKSGNGLAPVSLHLDNKTLSEILDEVSRTANVEIVRKGQKK